MPHTPPLRILHLAASERWTGAAEPLVSLARQQEAMGHKVWVGCTPGGSFESTARRIGVDVVEGLHLNRRVRPLQLLADMRFVPRFCRANDIDVVHCHLLHDHWIAALSLGSLRKAQGGRPLLLRTNHSGIAPRNDWSHRRLFFKYSDRLIGISSAAARSAETAFGRPEGSMPYVAGGIDLERFRPGLDREALRRELGIPPEAPVAGIVSRVRAGRGVRWLMRAVPLVFEALPNARILVVGRGELKKWFRAEIEKPLYEGRVLNGGYREDDLPLAYAAMDVTMFLGLGSEGTCRAILEAGACGRPTIGADVGAVPEIIEDGETGVLVRDRSVDCLAEAIIDLLRNSDRRVRMGEAARRLVEERFSEKARAERFMQIYAEALEERTGASEEPRN